MRNEQEKAIKKYLGKVSENVICLKRTKKFYEMEIEKILFSFAEHNSNVTYKDLEKNFGPPEAFAAQLSEKEEFAHLIKKAERRSLVLKTVGIVCAVVCTLAICLAVYLIVKYGGTTQVTNEM